MSNTEIRGVEATLDDAFHLLQDAVEKFVKAGRRDLADKVAELIEREGDQ